jgi:hypothetical protein
MADVDGDDAARPTLSVAVAARRDSSQQEKEAATTTTNLQSQRQQQRTQRRRSLLLRGEGEIAADEDEEEEVGDDGENAGSAIGWGWLDHCDQLWRTSFNRYRGEAAANNSGGGNIPLSLSLLEDTMMPAIGSSGSSSQSTQAVLAAIDEAIEEIRSAYL